MTSPHGAALPRVRVERWHRTGLNQAAFTAPIYIAPDAVRN